MATSTTRLPNGRMDATGGNYILFQGGDKVTAPGEYLGVEVDGTYSTMTSPLVRLEAGEIFPPGVWFRYGRL